MLVKGDPGGIMISWAKAARHDILIPLQLPNIETVVCDVRDWNATRRIVEELGDIHLLVNNAGVAETEDALDASPENFDWYVNQTDFR